MALYRLAILTSLALALLLVPAVATAQEGAQGLESWATASFPGSVTFHLRTQPPGAIARAELRFFTEQRACARRETSGYPDLAPTAGADVQWTWDLRRGGSLPPGAIVHYRWLLRDDSGRATETPWQTYRVMDTRYPWRTVTRGDVTLSWYEGDNAFAGKLMDAAAEALARLEASAGVRPSQPVQVFIYASGEDLRGSLVFPEEWTGGVAFTSFGIIAIGVSPSSLAWGSRAVAHELTHLIVDQISFSCLSEIPSWLNEGLATYNEDASREPQPGYDGPLQEAIASGRLLSVAGLGQGFPTDPQQALLAYGESFSLVKFLAEVYGPDRLRGLLEAFRQGVSAEEALQRAYGFGLEGLEAAWRRHIGAPLEAGDATPGRMPLPTPVLPAFEPYALPTSPPP
ncbi:MAG: hypothetical protein HY680_09845, partial [Chloroflexi bacterium]|nr:hypothetical protein [Chloroflexota bacterium]